MLTVIGAWRPKSPLKPAEGRREEKTKIMEEHRHSSATIPLIKPSSEIRGTATRIQTLGNILVSIVGTGVLGLPFAFKVAGWLAGSVGVLIAGVSTYYCMLLLVKCRDRLASEQGLTGTITYGDLGHKSSGLTGRYLTEFLISISQCGGSVAYLVFVGQNLASVFRGYNLNVTSYIFLLVPVEIALSLIRSLSAFAPFSIFADICNLLAMGTVIKQDVEHAIGGEFSFSKRQAITSLSSLPFAGGMAVFCFEGFGMTLALQASMRERDTFPKVLGQAFAGVTLVYILFGFFGYMAYGDQTRDIVTLNLPENWSTIAVQVGLCLALVFTFPMMVRPVNEIVECKLKRTAWFQKAPHKDDGTSMTASGKLVMYICRGMLVLGLAMVAMYVPGFGVFASLVGSTACALLSFVLPAYFHLRLMGSSLSLWEKSLDWFILSVGLVFAAHGTYSAIVGV